MKNQKILVLSDLKDTTNSTLKSAVSIATIIKADIDFFHVKKPINVVNNESQLSAIRDLNKDFSTTNKKIKNIIAPISEKYGQAISYNFSFGNVKNEIDQYIKQKTPDIIILGKQKTNTVNIIGNSITDYVLKKFNGIVFIIQHKIELEPNKLIPLGLLNHNKNSLTTSVTKKLLAHVSSPIISFNVSKNKESISELNKEVINYDFDQNSNTIKNLSSYLLKNKTRLLHINRDQKNLSKSDIKTAINKLNVSLLIT